MKPIDLLRVLGGVACMALAHAGIAATSTFVGTVSETDPKMPVVTINTPDCVGVGGVQVPHRAIPFSVEANGVYAFSAPNPGIAIHVYAGSFDPAAPLVNCIAASNVSPHNIAEALTAGTPYVLVVTDDFVATPGARFDVTVTGPGVIHGPCAGFDDVDAASGFCTDVHWIRNRGITLGCAANTYCPNSAVTRLQMAVFLRRMGDALAPVFLTGVQTLAQQAVNAGNVVCQTQDFEVANHPRVATVVGSMLSHRAPGTVRVLARIVYSTDQGANWEDMGSVSRSANIAGEYVSQSPAPPPLALDVNSRVRFGIGTFASSATVNDASCDLTVRIESRTGTAAPFDQRPSGASGPRASDGR